MNRKTIILILILVLVAVAAGFWYSQNKNPKKKTPEDIRRESNERIVEVEDVENIEELVDGMYEPEEVDTSDWQTYRNEDLRIEMKIPKDWFCAEDKFTYKRPSDKYSRACMSESAKDEYDGRDITTDTVVMHFTDDTATPADIRTHIKFLRSQFEYESKLYIIQIDTKKEILIEKVDKEKTLFSIIVRRGNEGFTFHFYKKTDDAKRIFDGIISTFKYID
ncbi:MAG: hypothetical protein U9O20_04425 [Patescibacteria group bacterium]|nr:hypothetical protein [Patescibacteria group bacterium]